MNRKYTRYIPTVLFFIFGVCYNYFTPLFTPPDEERPLCVWRIHCSETHSAVVHSCSRRQQCAYGIPSASCITWFARYFSLITSVYWKKNSLSMMGPAIVVSGWWFFSNWLMFNDPVFLENLWHLECVSSASVPLSLDYFKTVIEKTFTTFFGIFGSCEASRISPWIEE